MQIKSRVSRTLTARFGGCMIFRIVMCEVVNVVLVEFKNLIHRRRCLCERCPTQGDQH